MAFQKLNKNVGTEKTTNTVSTTTEEKEKDQYQYSNSNGLRLWGDDSLLTCNLRKNVTRDNLEVIVKITSTDENNKFIKDESGKFDQGYFPLSVWDLLQIQYGLQRLYNGETAGVTINHVNTKTNTGSQLEILLQEDGVYLWIEYVENANITREWKFLLDSNQEVSYYDNDGNQQKDIINGKLTVLKYFFDGAIAATTLGNNLIDFSSNSGGKANGGFVKSEKKVGGLLGSNKSNFSPATNKLDSAKLKYNNLEEDNDSDGGMPSLDDLPFDIDD